MLKLSTRGEYGVRAMLEIGLAEGESVTVQEISNKQGISAKYLEHLLSSLRKAELVLSERGPKGGYRLARPSSEITLGEILNVLEGGNPPVRCLRDDHGEKNACYWHEKCALQEIWVDVQSNILELLNDFTLGDICSKQKAIYEENNMYYI